MESLHIAVANNTLITAQHVLPMFSTQFKFTLVLHACGCHVDNFSSKKPDGEPSSSLENKICFRTKGSHKIQFGSGRFGGGQGFLTFGILDWKYGKKMKQQEQQS